MEITRRDLTFFKIVDELYAIGNGEPNIDTSVERLLARALTLLWQRLDELTPPGG